MPGRALAPTLPVYSPGDGTWRASTQQASLPAVAVPGVTVLDELAQEAAQLALRKRKRQVQRHEEEPEERPVTKLDRPASRHKARGDDVLRVGGPTHATESRELRRQEARQRLALAAQLLLQDPEKQLSQLKGLLDSVHDEDPQVCRLAMLTLLAVFKDLIPAYRIRSSTEEDAPEQLSKEVRALRAYESALLDAYHAYLKSLLRALKASNAGHAPIQQGRVAAKCMAGLLEAAPHFNYRSDLLQALVAYLPHQDVCIRQSAQGGLAALLASSSGSGDAATEAVQLIADLVRQNKCVLPSATFDCLSGLQFPDMQTPAGRADGQGEPRTKKHRKKERDAVDRSFLEAQVATDLALRQANQTATLDALFEMLFRVLKTCSSSELMQRNAAPLLRRRFQEKFPLLFPGLRLLSKYAHLISIEYIDDITAELQVLLRSSALPPQERLRVLLTAVDIVQYQGGTVAAEHDGFYFELYAALKHIMLVPLLDSWPTGSKGATASPKLKDHDWLFSAAAASQACSDNIGEQVCYLACQALEQLLLDSKLLDGVRQAAFLKRMLAVSAAAGDSGLSMGLLCVVQRMLRRSQRLQSMLQHEAGGPSTRAYHPEAEDPAEAGAIATPLWELSLLAQHYHPGVAAACALLAAGSWQLPLSGSVAAFAASRSTCTGAFNPAPQLK